MNLSALKQMLGVILLSVTLASCIKDIPLQFPPSIDSGIYIEGGLTIGKPEVGIVDLLFTSIGIDKTGTKPVRVNAVKMVNGQNQSIDILDNGFGRYKRVIKDSPSFRILIGEKYKILVTTIEGVEIESSYKTLLEAPPIDDLTYEVLTQDDGTKKINFLIDSKVVDENGSPIKLQWNIQQAFKYTSQLEFQPPSSVCYVYRNTNLLNVPIFNSANTGLSALDDYIVHSRSLDFQFAEGYVGIIIQQRIDEETEQFYKSYNTVIKRNGNIFEAPTGNIKSNYTITNDKQKVLFGHFYAVMQDTAFIKIAPGDVGNPKRQCPTPPSESTPCPISACCNCLVMLGSSYNPPYFW